jgi:hypothetical protein
MNKLHFAAGLALTAGTLMPMAYEAQPAFAADTARTCVDAQGGTIDSTDLINTTEIQRAVGAHVDGVFGKQTCDLTWQALMQLGHVSGEGKTLKIGQKHGFLG